MRKRHWVIYTFIFISVVAFTAFVGYRFFETNERIKVIVISELRPIIGEDFSVSKVHLDLSTIHFFDVFLPFADQKYVLKIGDLRIRYNLFQAVSSGFNPAAISRDIILIKPKFLITVNDSTIQQTAPTDSTRENILGNFVNSNWLNHLQYLNRLSIRDGEIVLLHKGHGPLKLGNSLRGVVQTQDNDSLVIRLEGKLLSSDKDNLFLESVIDREQGFVKTLNLNFNEYSLNTPLPSFLPEFINIRDGEMEGGFLLSRNEQKEFNYELTGGLAVKDFAADLWEENLSVENLFLISHMENWDAVIDTCKFELNNAKSLLKGRLHDIFHPKPNFQFNLNNFNLAHIKRFLDDSFTPSLKGTVDISGDLKGFFQRPTITTNIYSNKISLNDIVFSKVGLKAIVKKDVYNINKLTANLFNHKMKMKGVIKKSSDGLMLDGSLDLGGDLAPYLRNVANKCIDSCSSWLTAEISGELRKPTLFGSLGLKLVCPEENPVLFRDAFSLHDWKFRFIPVENNGDPTIALNLDVSQSEPHISFGIKNADKIAFKLWDIPYKNFLEQFAADISGQGVFNNMELTTRLQPVQQGGVKSNYVDIDSKLTTNGENLYSEGDMTFYAANGESIGGNYSFSKNEHEVALERLNIGDNLFFKLKLTQQEDSLKVVKGSLRTSAFQPVLFTTIADSQYSGKFNSDIEFNGTTEKPNVSGYIRLQDGFVYNNGPYAGLFEFSYDSTGFNLGDFNLNSNGESLLFAYGNCDRKFENFNFKLTGGGFDFSTITKSVFSTSPFLSGRSVIDLNLTGSKKNPVFEGLLAIRDGRLFSFPFDNFEMQLGKKNPNSDKLLNQKPGLSIRNFVVQRNNLFELNGTGFFPFNSNDSLDVNLSGSGDFLVLFSDLTDYFKKTASIGHLKLDLSGTPSSPVINNASLDLKDGYMQFKSVVPEVTNTTLSVKYEPERKFFNVEYITGLMGGDSFFIHNEMTDSLHVQADIEDFLIADTELSLGTFILQSGENGIPLSITGLMEKENYGQFILSGKNANESFIFAGPYSGPRLRGRIDLLGAQIMFPFAEGTGEPNGIIKDLLETMNWDIEVVPVKDVRYIRSFPGAIDNLYINLLIEDEFSKLDFLGQVRDESFRINGQVGSTTGLIEYLDMNFRIERAGAEFDNSSLIPVVYGNARTTVTDSMGVPTQVMLTAQTVDNTMRQQQVEDRIKDENSRGRWDQIRFRLSTDNPNLGNSETQILSALGYSANSFQGTAFDAIGFGTDNILFRPIFRPVERTLQNVFGLDYVRFNSRLAKNIIDFNLNNNYQLNTRLALLKSTRVIVGKYLANNLFFQYTGQIQAGIDYRYKEKGLGLNHKLGFEYHINPKLMLELEYNYDTLMSDNNEDKRIMLRHWFPF